MTKNSAELLYELFMSWWESGTFPSNSRNSILGSRIRETQQAAVYLAEIESFIESSDSFPEDHPLRDVIPKFWRWIFAAESWSGTGNSSYVSKTDIGLLYDFRYHPINHVGKPVASSLQVLLDELPRLIEEVDSDASLNDDVKRYVKTILHHVYKVLSVDSGASAFEQERAMSELVMALGLAAGRTQNSEKASGWKEWAEKAAGHFASGFMGAAGGSVWTLALTAGGAAGQIMGS
ncbi:MAG: hypothetical protein Q4A03_02440 [Rothia sp. (in: high G+C Gram-positive bacteria)]|uniref:hypothetical protein n=1 Tax=Rothia sp. (in: high G+C Gram-positive bacteria) TaxID=1885016 RepID=UPI0026FCAF30|nr:hypothetical protein [Rothia sp. (in: high G+C Gram-positive bacteria)]